MLVDVEKLMRDSHEIAQNVLSDKVSVAKASVVASHYRNIAKFLEIRAKHGNLAIPNK